MRTLQSQKSAEWRSKMAWSSLPPQGTHRLVAIVSARAAVPKYTYAGKTGFLHHAAPLHGPRHDARRKLLIIPETGA